VGDLRSAWVPVVGRSGAEAHGAAEIDGPYAPTVFLFDRFPGGVGLSERLFEEREALLARTHRIIAGCRCAHGCPACIGPMVAAAGAQPKALALQLLAAVDPRCSSAASARENPAAEACAVSPSGAPHANAEQEAGWR
jgi:DEAD/DEAH box helicase domain-containing protein